MHVLVPTFQKKKSYVPRPFSWLSVINGRLCGVYIFLKEDNKGCSLLQLALSPHLSNLESPNEATQSWREGELSSLPRQRGRPVFIGCPVTQTSARQQDAKPWQLSPIHRYTLKVREMLKNNGQPLLVYGVNIYQLRQLPWDFLVLPMHKKCFI